MEKLAFTEKSLEHLFSDMQSGKYPRNSIFNFLNSHSVYLFVKHPVFREHVLRKRNTNFIDGSILSVFFTFQKLRNVKRLKGIDFAEVLLNNQDLTKNKKHLFLGVSEEDLRKILKKYNLDKKNCLSYDLPMLKQNKFNDSGLVSIIRRFKPNFVWVSIGNPKQEILSNDLAEKVDADYFFNVGAFFDYAKEKKKKAPEVFQNLGIEWLYRLMTDFHHTWKKVRRSFIANKFLFRNVELKKF